MHQTYQRAIFAAGSLLTGLAVLQCRVTMMALDVEVVFAGFWVLGPDEVGMVLLRCWGEGGELGIEGE